ncbi:hypothetical protein VFPPC_03739 [Pochonia chlamydosporia 170]|uniref:C6 transcription factor n=1 Tax=Pochonia chlamydosporia 170 TaxID=1380566 RepID=A0A179G2P6_METCM|nr:hypothetical protein VFPPC_03739 [Pochonia chlamydosporia 170]OAQ71439.1 hypothetical protein VFPPC_03739 [Pochonia chlamydosporia 170]
MLSTAALDIIASSKDGAETAPYHQAALKYFNKSSALMRQELSNARGEETTHLLFLNATFTVYNHIAISQHLMTDGATQAPPLSAIQRACLLFEMCLGASYVMNLNPTALEKSLAYLPSLHEQWSSLPLDHLREEDRYGLSLLDSIKDAIFFGDANESEDTIITRDTYDGSMKRMRLCYSHDLHHVAQGFCMSFPKYSGSDLAKAAKAHDPMALLLIMYWGVLLHRLAADVWWIGPLGQQLVQEGAEIVSRSKLVHVPATLEAVMWTRLQTGNLD